MSFTHKIRIYDLAKDLKQDTNRVIEELRREGADVSMPSNFVGKELADRIRNKYFPKVNAVTKPLKRVTIRNAQIENDFIGKCQRMSGEQLSSYLNDCLSKICKQQHSNVVIPQHEETYNKLIELLAQKLFDKVITFESKLIRKEKCEETSACIEQMFVKKRRCFSNKNTKLVKFLSKPDEFSEIENTYDGTEVKSNQPMVLEKLPWRILPEGEWISKSLVKHFRDLSTKSKWQGKIFDENRLIKIESNLNPTHRYIGEKDFEGYVVYCFDWTNKVILECPIYGNATYVISGDWKEIARVSKWMARNKYSKQVTAVRHSKLWFQNIKVALKNSY